MTYLLGLYATHTLHSVELKGWLVHHLEYFSNGSFAKLGLNLVEGSALERNVLFLWRGQQLLGLIVVTLRKGLQLLLNFIVELGSWALFLLNLLVLRHLAKVRVILAFAVGRTTLSAACERASGMTSICLIRRVLFY